jgi:hypothetical protein
MEVIVKIDTGTDTKNRYILNPWLLLLVDLWMAQGKQIGKLFGIGVEK